MNSWVTVVQWTPKSTRLDFRCAERCVVNAGEMKPVSTSRTLFGSEGKSLLQHLSYGELILGINEKNMVDNSDIRQVR